MFLLENIVFQEAINFLMESSLDGEQKKKTIEKLMLDSRVLTFSRDNSKLGKDVAVFALPAGWTCPFAKDCKMKVDRNRDDNGKIGMKAGEDIKYMCYAAWMEVKYDKLRNNHWHNYDLLQEQQSMNGMIDLIIKSIDYHFKTKGSTDSIRIHESGDFYNGEYLQAWIEVARRKPNIEFYAYTKSLPYLKKFEAELKGTPNLKINISTGGSRPDLENELGLPKAHVYNTPEEVFKAGKLVDLDDSIAKDKNNVEDFALMVHGTQTKEVDTPDITKNKIRNEVFMKYNKYKKALNAELGLDDNHEISNDEAKELTTEIKKLFSANKIAKGKADVLLELLRAVIKYNNYRFDKSLLAIVPDKFK